MVIQLLIVILIAIQIDSKLSQNLNQVVHDEFFFALWSLSVTKDDISGEPLKIMYSDVPPYITHQRHSTLT